MPSGHTNSDVFVSYAANDRERVRPLVESLQQAGLDVWWDRRIAPGAGFDSEIQDALDHARCVLVVWSKESVNSDWVITEAGEGLERGVLVPIVIDSVRPPLAFRRRQTIDVTASKSPSDEVLNGVRNLLDGRAVELPNFHQRKRRPLFWILATVNLAVLLVVAALLWEGLENNSLSRSKQLVRAPLPLEGWVGSINLFATETTMQISPQGDVVAFVGVKDNGRRVLKIRRLDALDSILLPKTEDATSLFFSPDGDWVGYFTIDRLERVPVDGGEPILLASGLDKDFWGASWGEDDNIVFSVGRTGLRSISIRGGKVATLTELDKTRSEGSHRLPHHVSGHDVLLFTIMIEGSFTHEIWALNLSTGERNYLFDGIAPSYIAPGYIVFAKGEATDRGSLWAVRFNPQQMLVTDQPQLIQSSVGGREGMGYSSAFDGPLVYIPSQGLRRAKLVVVEKNHEPRVIAEDSWFERPAFSQDGKSIAVARVTDPSRPASIWIYDLESGGRRLFAESGDFPLWHNDDQAITFVELGVGIVTERLDDPKSRRTLVKHPQVIIPTQWIDEGKSLVYAAVNPETKGDAYILKIGGEARHLYSRGASGPNITPDGRWLALCTWPRGVLVGKLPNFSSISVAAPGGCQPRWSSDGSKLYYAEYDKLWVVQIDSKASSIVFGKREVVSDFGFIPGRFQYDVDQDDRIAIIQGSYDSPKPPVLMLNWRHKLDEI